MPDTSCSANVERGNIEAAFHEVELQRGVGIGFQVHVVDDQVLVHAEAPRLGHRDDAGFVHVVHRQAQRTAANARNARRDPVITRSGDVDRIFQPLAIGQVAHVADTGVAVLGVHRLVGAGHRGSRKAPWLATSESL